jgi:5-methylcytosine-specific restriction protein A
MGIWRKRRSELGVLTGDTSLSTFCAQLGLPLSNVRRSWCAHSEEQKKALFTLWAHERLQDGTWEFPWSYDQSQKDAGRNEFRRVFDQAVREQYDVVGVLCHAKDENAKKIERKSFDRSPIMVLALTNTNGRRFARVVGELEQLDIQAQYAEFLRAHGSAENDLNAEMIGNVAPEAALRLGIVYPRNERVRKKVVKRSAGRCEYCGINPFVKSDGRPYLETHHIISLANKGPDTPANVIALCANHHREAHFGANWQQLNIEFAAIIKGTAALK